MYSKNEEAQIIKDMSASIYNNEKTYTEEELSKDPIWIEASKAVYKKLNGYELMGSEQEIAKQGLDIMGEFNYNMTLGTIGQTVKMQDADDYTQTAFYYMMDTYDKKDISRAGVVRALTEMTIYDPLTIAMAFGTGGVAYFGKQAAGTAVKSTLKETLRQAATRYVGSTVAVGATEGAIFTGADDYARQVAGIRAGIQEKYDPIRGAIATGVGGAFGGGLGYVAEKGVKAVGKGISNVIKSGEEEMMKAAGGGTPPTVDFIPHSAYSEAKASQEKSFNPLKKTIRLDEDSVIVGTQKEDAEVYIGRDKNGEYFTIGREDAINQNNKYNQSLKEANDATVKTDVNKGINKVIESGEEEMMKAAGGGTPPVEKDVVQEIDIKSVPTNLYKPDQITEGVADFYTRANNNLDKMKQLTQRYIAKKPPIPKKLYRGVPEEGFERKGGGAKEGFGLYTTVDKELASNYGKVLEMDPETSLPKKPLVFSGMNEFEIWEQQLQFNVLKYRRASDMKDITLNEIVHFMYPDVDGIQIGSGVDAKSGSYWVKFPDVKDIINTKKD